MSATAVEFYFDVVSPYAWLAAEQLERIEEYGGRIVCRPILFAALLDACGTRGPAEVPAKRAYLFRDVMRQAKQLGLPFRGPPTHPFNPLAALRAIHAIGDDARRLQLARHLLSAVWSDGIDVGDPHALRATLREVGFDADALAAAATSAEVKSGLRAATQAAIDAGIFGVPTFRVRGELFWGGDRTETVCWALRGGAIDERLCMQALARPAAAVRQQPAPTEDHGPT